MCIWYPGNKLKFGKKGTKKRTKKKRKEIGRLKKRSAGKQTDKIGSTEIFLGYRAENIYSTDPTLCRAQKFRFKKKKCREITCCLKVC